MTWRFRRRHGTGSCGCCTSTSTRKESSTRRWCCSEDGSGVVRSCLGASAAEDVQGSQFSVSSEESRTGGRDAMDAAVQHLQVVPLHLFFEEEGAGCLLQHKWHWCGTLTAWVHRRRLRPRQHGAVDVVGDPQRCCRRPAARPGPPRAAPPQTLASCCMEEQEEKIRALASMAAACSGAVVSSRRLVASRGADVAD